MDIVNVLNNSKYFSGIVMVLLNIGSKYISAELSESQQLFLSHPIIRKALIFTVFFIATKDIVVSLILSIVFLLLVCIIFHEDSNYCLFSSSLRKFCDTRRENVSKEEYIKAKNIVKAYDKNRMRLKEL